MLELFLLLGHEAEVFWGEKYLKDGLVETIASFFLSALSHFVDN